MIKWMVSSTWKLGLFSGPFSVPFHVLDRSVQPQWPHIAFVAYAIFTRLINLEVYVKWCPDPPSSLAGQTLFPVWGVAGSAEGKKSLVSLGHIPWPLQECGQIQ